MNPWREFQQLIQPPSLLLGSVGFIYADGTCLVNITGGGSVRVIGTEAQGQKVWVRNGRIEGQAPDAELIEIVI